MKTINLNKQHGVDLVLFPDNQPHVNIKGIVPGDQVKVICCMDNSLTVVQLLETVNALEHIGAVKQELHIPYLMGARSDRVMNPGDSVDIEVISALVNSLDFKEVFLYDAHSEVSLKLIKNSQDLTNIKLVKAYQGRDAVLICPDKGARRKVADYLKWNPSIEDVVYCDKVRDLENKGRITLTVLNPEKCEYRHVVVIDDLCDGGGTFLGIADQIKHPLSMTLIVTHGVFSKGYSKLLEYYNHIITSNSRTITPNQKVTVINLF